MTYGLKQFFLKKGTNLANADFTRLVVINSFAIKQFHYVFVLNEITQKTTTTKTLFSH